MRNEEAASECCQRWIQGVVIYISLKVLLTFLLNWQFKVVFQSVRRSLIVKAQEEALGWVGWMDSSVWQFRVLFHSIVDKKKFEVPWIAV